MVTKRLCDICGAEIPNPNIVEHNNAAQMVSGCFTYGSGIMIHELDDLCESCGEKVAEFINKLKRKKE